MAVDITRRPTVAVTNLAPPTFDGNFYFEINWSVPSLATDEERNDRFDHIQIDFVWDATGEGSEKTSDGKDATNPKAILDYKGLNCTQYVSSSDTMVGYYFDNSVFYPQYQYYNSRKNRATLYAKSLTVYVYGVNSYGEGPRASSTYVFHTPRDLYYAEEGKGFSEVSFDESTGIISRSVEMYTGKNAYHRSTAKLSMKRCVYTGSNASGWVLVDSRTLPQNYDPEIESSYSITTQFDDDNAGSYSQTSFRNITRNQDIRYSWELLQQGYAGSQSTSGWFMLRWPPKPTIGKITLSDPNFLKANPQDVRVNIPFTVTYSTTYKETASYGRSLEEPPISYKLQILKSSTSDTAAKAALEANWSDVSGATDNSLASGFTDIYANAVGQPGEHIWYRVVATRIGHTEVSAPVEAKDIFKEAIGTQDLSVSIYSADPDEDGQGITLLVLWNEPSSSVEATDKGVEISWSDYKDAWESNTPPETFEVDWTNQDLIPQGSTYTKAAKVSIRNLEEGTPYYMRARQFGDYGDGRIYGGYAYLSSSGIKATVTPVSSIQNLTLNVASYKKMYESLYLSWGYDSGTAQTSWRIWYYSNSKNNWVEAAASTETDSKAYTTIEWSKILSIISENNSMGIRFKVEMSVGGPSATSEEKIVTYRKAPAVDFSILSLNEERTESETSQGTTSDDDGDTVVYALKEQPIFFSYGCSYDQAKVLVSVISQGNSIAGPGGFEPQPNGEVLWSNIYTIDSASSNTTYDPIHKIYNVSGDDVFIPIIEMRDGCWYTVEITATDPLLSSNTTTITKILQPDWLSDVYPTPPSYDSTVVVDADTKVATITPVAGTGANADDTAEIYRVTPDGPVLVLSKAAFLDDNGYSVSYEDRYVPYSDIAELQYRIAARTVYGQVEWIDIPYALSPSIGWLRGEPFYTMRFDWGNGRYLEVPYNLEFQDSYNKDFEAKTNLDGTITGWWNSAIKKSKSLKTVAVKFSDPQQIELIRELAQYSGPVFVRTPDGDAFQADVQVSSLDNKYDGLTLSVSFKATALTLTDEFKMKMDLAYRGDPSEQ